MFVKSTITFIYTLLYAVISFSQFNDSVHHYINYTSAGVINTTNNSKSYVLNNALRFNISKKSLHLNSASSWIYGEQQKQLTNNDFNSTLDFNIFRTRSRFYYWGLAGYTKSYSLKINNRVQSGAGLAYNFIDTTTAFLNISDGILYENSSLKSNDSTNNYNSLFRNSFRLRYHFVIKEIIIFDGTNFLQNALGYRNDYILNFNNSVSVKLRKWLNLTTASSYNRNQKTNSANLLITFGLSAEKYF